MNGSSFPLEEHSDTCNSCAERNEKFEATRVETTLLGAQHVAGLKLAFHQIFSFMKWHLFFKRHNNIVTYVQIINFQFNSSWKPIN